MLPRLSYIVVVSASNSVSLAVAASVPDRPSDSRATHRICALACLVASRIRTGSASGNGRRWARRAKYNADMVSSAGRESIQATTNRRNAGPNLLVLQGGDHGRVGHQE